MAKIKVVSSSELDPKRGLQARSYFEMNDLKPLSSEQKRALLVAARAWKAQGSRDKWSTGPSKHLWDVVNGIEEDNARRKWDGEGDPKVGDNVYVGTQAYISHGADDFQGGLVEVSRVYKSMSAGRMVTWIEIVERPGHGYNWEDFLKGEQEELAKQFGEHRGYEDPDNHPSANTGTL